MTARREMPNMPTAPISLEQRYGIDWQDARALYEIMEACPAPSKPGRVEVEKLPKAQRATARALCFAYDNGWFRGRKEATESKAK